MGLALLTSACGNGNGTEQARSLASQAAADRAAAEAAAAQAAADRAASEASAAAVPAPDEKSEANIRACRGAGAVKIKTQELLQQAVDGGGYLMSSGDTIFIKLMLADAVSGADAAPTGDIGDGAVKAFDLGQEIQGSGTQGFIAPRTAQDLLESLDATIEACRTAGVTGDEVSAVPPPL